MVTWPKLASSFGIFRSDRFRVAVLIALIFSLLPTVTFGGSVTPTPPAFPSAEADFIIGPQVPISNSWFDTTEISRAQFHGGAFPAEPPTTNVDPYILAHYYDLVLTEYIAYERTGDPGFLTLARKVADSWWKFSYIQEGRVRNFDSAGPAPRHAGLGGLMLRAMDGRPEMWDWINAYTRYHFDVWLKARINNTQLYYGVREGAFALHYATWLAKALPDTFPLQSGGTQTNGAAIRAQYLADIEAVATNYYGRLQLSDGSWRWDDIDYRDADGGQLKGIMQPFMIGLLLNALIDVHRLTTNTTVKSNIQNQISKACRHLYEAGPYRRNEPVPADPSKRWRSFWYFYHGGTTVNPTKYQNGGGSYTGAALWEVKSERQSISTILPAFGYAYLLTNDSFFKTAGDELFDAAYGATDSIRNEADGTAKNYNQNYRRGGSYLVWRQGTASSNPTPTPTPNPTPTPTPTPTPIPTPTPTPTPTPNPTPTPTPTPNPTPPPDPGPGQSVRKAKRKGQDLSNKLATSSATAGPVSSTDSATMEEIQLFINEIQLAQSDFRAEPLIYPAEAKIDQELVSALQYALMASSSLSQGNLDGVQSNLRTGINCLELADVLISYGNIANPIDAASYMVRQHYVDFLDREPDQGGGDFWVGQFSSCGTNAQCLAARRINVSAAFFHSIEFQQTGYFVYRLYKSSFWRLPLRTEFMADTLAVSRGVIVGADGWEAKLAANKQEFLDRWVQGADFMSIYSRLNNRQYVDALIYNLRVSVSSSERNALITELSNGSSRAIVLGKLAQNPAFTAAEFNRAFVLMQYFGYLRRDPDADGFNFWLNKLNQFGGNYERGEMVKAFLASIEYRNRFVW